MPLKQRLEPLCKARRTRGRRRRRRRRATTTRQDLELVPNHEAEEEVNLGKIRTNQGETRRRRRRILRQDLQTAGLDTASHFQLKSVKISASLCAAATAAAIENKQEPTPLCAAQIAPLTTASVHNQTQHIAASVYLPRRRRRQRQKAQLSAAQEYYQHRHRHRPQSQLKLQPEPRPQLRPQPHPRNQQDALPSPEDAFCEMDLPICAGTSRLSCIEDEDERSLCLCQFSEFVRRSQMDRFGLQMSHWRTLSSQLWGPSSAPVEAALRPPLLPLGPLQLPPLPSRQMEEQPAIGDYYCTCFVLLLLLLLFRARKWHRPHWHCKWLGNPPMFAAAAAAAAAFIHKSIRVEPGATFLTRLPEALASVSHQPKNIFKLARLYVLGPAPTSPLASDRKFANWLASAQDVVGPAPAAINQSWPLLHLQMTSTSAKPKLHQKSANNNNCPDDDAMTMQQSGRSGGGQLAANFAPSVDPNLAFKSSRQKDQLKAIRRRNLTGRTSKPEQISTCIYTAKKQPKGHTSGGGTKEAHRVAWLRVLVGVALAVIILPSNGPQSVSGSHVLSGSAMKEEPLSAGANLVLDRQDADADDLAQLAAANQPGALGPVWMMNSTSTGSSSLATLPPSKSQPKTSKEYHWPFLLLVVFMFIGATGNILVCMAVWRDRRLQTATNYFLLSLAVADLLVCTLVMPFGIIYGFFGYWPFDIRVCNLWVTCDVLTCSSSILHMCFISVGRYLGIRNPLHARQAKMFGSKRAVLWRIAMAWFAAALITSPITIMSLLNQKDIMPMDGECAISNPSFLIFGSLFAFFLPMFVMVPTYVMTVRLLSRRAKFVRNNSLLMTDQTDATNAGSQNGAKSGQTMEIEATTVRDSADDGASCTKEANKLADFSATNYTQNRANNRNLNRCQCHKAANQQLVAASQSGKPIGESTNGQEVTRFIDEDEPVLDSKQVAPPESQHLTSKSSNGLLPVASMVQQRANKRRAGRSCCRKCCTLAACNEIQSGDGAKSVKCSQCPRLASQGNCKNGPKPSKCPMNLVETPSHHSPGKHHSTNNKEVGPPERSSQVCLHSGCKFNRQQQLSSSDKSSPTAGLSEATANNSEAPLVGGGGQSREQPDKSKPTNGLSRLNGGPSATFSIPKLLVVGAESNNNNNFMATTTTTNSDNDTSVLACHSSGEEPAKQQLHKQHPISTKEQSEPEVDCSCRRRGGMIKSHDDEWKQGSQLSAGPTANGERFLNNNNQSDLVVELSNRPMLIDESAGSCGVRSSRDCQPHQQHHHHRHRHHHNHNHHHHHCHSHSHGHDASQRHHHQHHHHSHHNHQHHSPTTDQEQPNSRHRHNKSHHRHRKSPEQPCLVDGPHSKSSICPSCNKTLPSATAAAAQREPLKAPQAPSDLASSANSSEFCNDDEDDVQSTTTSSLGKSRRKLRTDSIVSASLVVATIPAINSNSIGPEIKRRVSVNNASNQRAGATSQLASAGADSQPQMIRYLGSSSQVRSEQKATKVLGLVFVTFVICWTPFFVINFSQGVFERKVFEEWISEQAMTVFLWLGYISSTINPVIYTVFNRNFRRAFRRLLLCQSPNQRELLDRFRASQVNKSFRYSQYARQHPGATLASTNNFNSSFYSTHNNNNNQTNSTATKVSFRAANSSKANSNNPPTATHAIQTPTQTSSNNQSDAATVAASTKQPEPTLKSTDLPESSTNSQPQTSSQNYSVMRLVEP